MAIDNKDKKVLKSSIEREQNELACSAEREKIKGSKNLNVPPLRFPEFNGEWEKCKISDLLDFYSTNSLSWEQLEYDTNAMMNLHYGLIHVGLPTMIDLAKDKLPNIKEGNMPKNFEMCKEGDVAFADASEDTNEVAKTVEFFKLAGKNVVCGLHTIHGRDNKHKTVVGFKGYAFLSATFHNQIRRIAQGTKIYSISTKNFSECYIGLPSKPEQTKIATLLRLIDERIATQNKIIEDLKLLKSAIVDKLMTPQKEWKSTKIGNVLSIGSGRDYKHLEDGNIPVYGTGGYMLSVDSYLYDGESVCIGRKGTINKPIFLKGKFWTVDTLFYTHTFRSITPRFCYYLFTTIDWLKYNEASGVPSLSKVTIENISISIPDLVTQKQLCAVLDSMTDKLDIEQKLLDAYHAQKQYLLEQI